jgi:tRNA dimethylallyltransferase
MNTSAKAKISDLIVILGPTASGKTRYSIEMAKGFEYQVEVINADSRQLYKYLDIGTAKVSPKEMDGVSHHLINVLDPKEEISVGWYQTEAKRIIAEVKERGNMPMLVGGSMLYLSAITDGLSMAPTPSAELRQKLIDEYDKDQGKSLYKRLRDIDPETASKIHVNNKPRLVRAVEIFELTNEKKADVVPNSELRPRDRILEYSNIRMVGINVDRVELHKRINERTRIMFENGWVEEVRELMDKGYGPDDPGMKSCGYREIMEDIRSGNLDEEELIEVMSAKTRQYARRQLTWWRGDERINWINA